MAGTDKINFEAKDGDLYHQVRSIDYIESGFEWEMGSFAMRLFKYEIEYDEENQSKEENFYAKHFYATITWILGVRQLASRSHR